MSTITLPANDPRGLALKSDQLTPKELADTTSYLSDKYSIELAGGVGGK